MHFVFGAPKNAKTFQLSLIHFRTDLTRVEASRHSAEALLSSLPRLPARDRDASGRHQNIFEFMRTLLRTPKRKTPGKIPRAFAMLGRSAWPISDKSGLVYEFVVVRKHAAWLPAAFERQLVPTPAHGDVTAFQRVRIACDVWSVRSHFAARLFA